MINHKKYELLLEFFKKELYRCDFIINESLTYNFCINCDSREWIFSEKINGDVIYFNSKYFVDFLFKIFDLPQYHSIDYPYLIRNLLFNSIEVLNEKFYCKFDEGYIKHKILISNISDKVKLHPESVNIIIERIKSYEN